MNADIINVNKQVKINDAKMKTKTPKINNYKWNVLRKLTRRINLLIDKSNLNNLKIIIIRIL